MNYDSYRSIGVDQCQSKHGAEWFWPMEMLGYTQRRLDMLSSNYGWWLGDTHPNNWAYFPNSQPIINVPHYVVQMNSIAFGNQRCQSPTRFVRWCSMIFLSRQPVIFHDTGGQSPEILSHGKVCSSILKAGCRIQTLVADFPQIYIYRVFMHKTSECIVGRLWKENRWIIRICWHIDASFADGSKTLVYITQKFGITCNIHKQS